LSTTIGSGAAWSPDGRQIFYEPGPAAANRLAVIEARTVPAVIAGPPAAMEFRRRLEQNTTYRAYDISPDGRQFVMAVSDEADPTAQQRAPQINIVLDRGAAAASAAEIR